jgi:hypothetical protein
MVEGYCRNFNTVWWKVIVDDLFFLLTYEIYMVKEKN